MVAYDDPGAAAVEPDEPRFARFTTNGRVHVLQSSLKGLFGLSKPSLSDFLLARQQGLCGATGRMGGQDNVSAFSDLELCRQCWKLWPHDKDLLFQHPVE